MTLRVALVGCGAIAEIMARRVYRFGHRDEAAPRVVAAIDPDPARAQLIASLTGAVPFAGLAEAAAAVHLDAADIRTPHHTHVELARTAVGLGLHVLVEKPVATCVESAAALLELGGPTVSVAENYGLIPAVEHAAGQLRAGMIGRLVSARSTRAFEIGPPWVKDWRLDGELPGSGVVIDQCCHQVRMLRAVVGEIVAVQAVSTGTGVPGSAPDVCAINLRFAGGVVGQLLLTWASGTPSPGPELQVFGTDGSLEVHVSYDEPGGGCTTWRRNAIGAQVAAGGYDYYDSLDRVVLHWAQVVAGTAESRIDVAEAIRDLAVAEAVVAALRTGHWCAVHIPAAVGGGR